MKESKRKYFVVNKKYKLILLQMTVPICLFLFITCKHCPAWSLCTFVCLFLMNRSDNAYFIITFIFYFIFFNISFNKTKLERKAAWILMAMSVKVVMYLFIFFVFADHTDGYYQWKQRKLARSSDATSESVEERHNTEFRVLRRKDYPKR